MEKYGNMVFPNKSETVKEVKLSIWIPVSRYSRNLRQHTIFQITRYLVKYFMNENCCKSRTKTDIDMKLGSVSHLEKKEKMSTSMSCSPTVEDGGGGGVPTGGTGESPFPSSFHVISQ